MTDLRGMSGYDDPTTIEMLVGGDRADLDRLAVWLIAAGAVPRATYCPDGPTLIGTELYALYRVHALSHAARETFLCEPPAGADLDALYRAEEKPLAHVLSCVRGLPRDQQALFLFLLGWTLHARWQHEDRRCRGRETCPFCAGVLPFEDPEGETRGRLFGPGLFWSDT